MMKLTFKSLYNNSQKAENIMNACKLTIALVLGAISLNVSANEVNAEKLAIKYYNIAKAINPDYKAPSVTDGKLFFNRKFNVNGKMIACASCHTTNPANEGKNIVTHKPIKPLAPTINPNRFSDLDKVEDKFTEHCNDILGADCTAMEKANFISYLITEKTPTK
jgi:uncharacterized membrane protein